MLEPSSASRGASIGHVSPEAAAGGEFALIEEGDIIQIDIPAYKVHLQVSDEELERRRAAWKRPEKDIPGRWLKRYAAMVSSADKGAILS